MSAPAPLITTSITQDRSELADTTAWDGLAVASSRPYCAPGWMLPWWDRLRPEGGALHTVSVSDGASLIGQLPLSLSTDRWGINTAHLLGHSTSSYSEPLALAGREREVAAALTASLNGGGECIDILSFTGIPPDSPWPRLLQETWPGQRPKFSLVSSMEAPFVDIPAGGFDAWLGGKSRNFRQQTRSRSREFLRRGGRFTRAESPTEMAGGLQALERLHLDRWSDRGGSQALVPGVVQMLDEAVAALGPERVHLWTAEVDGVAVASALLLSAGQEMHYWLGGFDEEWAPLSLSVLLLVEAIRHAAESNYSRVSLGPGAQPYKYRLATGAERLDWIDLLPISRRYPYVRLVQAPHRGYRLAARRTPPAVKERLRSAVDQVRHPPWSRPRPNGEGSTAGGRKGG